MQTPAHARAPPISTHAHHPLPQSRPATQAFKEVQSQAAAAAAAGLPPPGAVSVQMTPAGFPAAPAGAPPSGYPPAAGAPASAYPVVPGAGTTARGKK
jgi:hypothetical protein